MSKHFQSVPVNKMADTFDAGIAIGKIAIKDLSILERVTFEEEAKHSHRHDRHSFFLLEEGTITLEIDFQKHIVTSPSITYIHPDQVHRTVALENIVVFSLGINNENLNSEYLQLLEDVVINAKALLLDKETFSIISEAISLCLKFSERKYDRLYNSLLKDSCNALVALIISQYLEHSASIDKLSRFEAVTRTFRKLLELNYSTNKRPATYAEKLNISTPYLNECVKNTTGHPVSYHIHQRVILEAKRLLYHSDASVKEIAATLGYDDYPYFSRLFRKIAGMTALAFRNKNRD